MKLVWLYKLLYQQQKIVFYLQFFKATESLCSLTNMIQSTISRILDLQPFFYEEIAYQLQMIAVLQIILILFDISPKIVT